MIALRKAYLAGALALSLLAPACGPKKPAASESSVDPCASVYGAFARTLCSNPELTPLAKKVKNDFSSAAREMSAQGKNIVADNQRRWLAAQRVLCGVKDASAPLTTEAAQCLEEAFKARVKNADEVIQSLGGFKFQRVEIADAAVVSPEAAEATGMGADAPTAVSTDIRFPRIDGGGAAAQKFNAFVAQTPRFKPQDQTDESVTYTIAYAGPDLISVRFDTYDYSHGAAHPNTGMKAVNFNMKTRAELQAADIFKPNSRWQAFLAGRVIGRLNKKIEEAGEDRTPSLDEVQDAVATPNAWVIGANGLRVLFPPNSLGPGILGSYEVLVPWAALRAYLNPAAPGPISAS